MSQIVVDTDVAWSATVWTFSFPVGQDGILQRVGNRLATRLERRLPTGAQIANLPHN